MSETLMKKPSKEALRSAMDSCVGQKSEGRELIACPDCDLIQTIDYPISTNSQVICQRCNHSLERTFCHSLDVSLACWFAVLVLLGGISMLPLIHVNLLGLEKSFGFFDGALAFISEGWVFLGVLTVLVAFLIPLVRSTLLVIILGSLRFNWEFKSIGPLYRYARHTRLWAVPEVFVLGYGITFIQISDQVSLDYGPGAWSIFGIAILSIIGNSTLDKRSVWRAIFPQEKIASPQNPLICSSCSYIFTTSAKKRICPRCKARYQKRNPYSLQITMALIVTACMFLIPSYVYSIGILKEPLGTESYTIMGSAIEMAGSGYWIFAIIIIVASMLVPIGKLVGLTWMVSSIWARSGRLKLAKTRTYRFIHEIGRWSFTDVFVAAATVSTLSFNQIMNAQTGSAVLPFALVVIATMLASDSFDSRLIWDTPQ